MSAEIIAFGIVFAVELVAGIQFEKAGAKERRAEWRRRKGVGSRRRHEPRPLEPTAVIDAVAALAAHKLNVTIGVMHEDEHGGAIKKNVTADDGGPVI